MARRKRSYSKPSNKEPSDEKPSNGEVPSDEMSSQEETPSVLVRFLWGDGGYITFLSLAAIEVVFLIYFLDNEWTVTDRWSFIGFVLAIMGSRVFMQASSTREKVFYVIFLIVLCLAAFFWNLFVGHDCTTCALSLPDLVRKYVVPDPGQRRLEVWHLFTDENKTPQMCASCLIYVSEKLKWFDYVPRGIKKHVAEETFDSMKDFADITTFSHHPAPGEVDCQDAGFCPTVQDHTALSPTELREIDEWYEAMRKATVPKNAFRDFLSALAADVNSDLGNELLSNMTHDFLCYPASRLNGPKPSEFLKNIRVPRFTGEEDVEGDGPMEIEFDKLVAIMRGDKMHSLRPDVCAMIRLAGMLSNDDTVLTTSMSAAKVAPIANEEGLKGHDVGLLFPGLYVPKVDEDKAPNGSSSVEMLISLYKRLPIVDDATWFETREEYLALFRWLIEHKVQDEFYFPHWLSRNGTEEIGELVAYQFRFRGERQRIFESTSDTTLADRAFYGAGVKTLSRIVLPGDPSYGYLVPPEYYTTPAERDFFRNKAMPSEQDLLRMATVAWGKPVQDIESLRDKVVQIDYTIVSHWQYREAFEENGAILYLDARNRTPIGIWVVCREQLVLPSGGIAWEHAKFIYRSSEVVTAAMMHVGEYHLGWANRFNVALKQTLSDSHGLRSLMKPYTHGTGAVNWNAYQMLVLEDSILARADGFTNRGRSSAWGHFVKHSDMRSTFPQMLEAKGLEGISNLTTTLPYFTQGVRLWDIHYEYVNNFVNLIYGEDDTIFLEDDALHRFWHHINTNGRHLDPCICDMDSDMFFEKDLWPAFETTRTCAGLLDHEDFRTNDADSKHRRELWCKQTLPHERSKALYDWLKTDCEESEECSEVSFEREHLRPDMGLPELSREALVNLITRFIYEVTAGHELAADNLPFIVDPAYGGVRRLKDYDHSQQPMVDVSTWIFGTVIAALTTIRSMPLLADWSDLLESWADNQADWKRLSDADREKRKAAVRQMHFDYKSKLIVNADQFLKESLQRPENQWSPFLNPSVQAGSIAV